MVLGACLALALVCLIQQLPWLPGPWPVSGLLAVGTVPLWSVFGIRYCLLIVPALWFILTHHWVIGDRLAPELSQQDFLVQGTVCEFPRTGRRVIRFMLQPADGESVPRLPRRIYLSWYEASSLPRAGESWQLKVKLRRPRGLSNPGAFDFERWSYLHRIGATGYVRRSTLNHRIAARSTDCRLTGFRERIAKKIETALPQSSVAGHLMALSVGARHRLTREDWALLRRTGTVHLMAISGLHVGLVAVLLLFLGRQFGRVLLLAGVHCAPLFIGRWWALAGAAAYSALAGFALPTLRAFVMVAVAVALATVRRSISGSRILATALFAVLLVEPAAPLGAAFWLSFYAVALLLIRSLQLPRNADHDLSRVRRAWGRLGQFFNAQFALAVGLAPLSMMFFGQVSVIAPICNLIVVPVFGLLIVPLTLAGTVGLMFSAEIGAGILQPAAWLMESVLRFLAWLDELPITVWQSSATSVARTFMTIGATLILVWPRPARGRLIALALLVPILTGSARSVPAVLRVVVMDVGQGLAVLIQTAEHALVYDAGPAFRGSDAGRNVVLPVLRQFGIDKLDTVVISHGDSDHVGGVATVLAAYPDAAVITPESLSTTAFSPKSLSPETLSPETLSAESPRHSVCTAGMQWSWDGVLFRFVHPDATKVRNAWSDNDGSCVLLIQSAQTGVLLPGDIERRAEAYIVRHARLPNVDLVIAPHHGSGSSSSDPFVAATRPRFVVFSAGHQNRWGFPNAKVAGRWRKAGARELTTAENGALVFEADDTGRLLLRRRHRIDDRRIWTEGARSRAIQ